MIQWSHMEYVGSCLCGQITFTMKGPVDDYGYCHCSMCRKASGSAHSANVTVMESDFELRDPNAYIKEYMSSPGTHRFFCSHCGSPIYTRKDARPDTVRVRLGALDTPFEKTASRHTFVANKAPWHTITDNLPQFPERFTDT